MKLARHSNLCSIFAFGEQEQKIFSNPFIAYGYYKKYRINLISGIKEEFTLAQLSQRLDGIDPNADYSHPYVFHLFYELGYYFLDQSELIRDDQLLAIELLYYEVHDYKAPNEKCSFHRIDGPSYFDYCENFVKGYQNLILGNCYQFNLTAPYRFKTTSSDLDTAISTLWGKRPPAYAHATQIPLLSRQYISNSPECLFQMSGSKLWTMPIKGTLSYDSKECFKEKWQQLGSCKKNGAELDMITDMLRNDLSAIDKPIAKVIKRRAPLVVPSILHQFSLISVQLSSKVTLGRILRALFPGGSVTGAPKKRVVGILKELEQRARGFYCGSTILLYKNTRAASINIRSLEIDTSSHELLYQAGGGITLSSESESEFMEMELKVASTFPSI